jgi:hypothetical protein
MRELQKNVTLGDATFVVKKMDPRTASWLAFQIMSHVLPSPVETGLDKEGFSLPSNEKRTSPMAEAEFLKLQDHCLRACAYLETLSVGQPPVEMPLIHASGRLNYPDKLDVVAILTLTIHALLFNVAPFFDPAVQAAIQATFADLILPPAAS